MSDYQPDHREPHLDSPTPEHSDARRIDRRAFLKGGLIAGGSILGGALAVSELARAVDGSSGTPLTADLSAPLPNRVYFPRKTGRPPNILVVLVDQFRSRPRWLSPEPIASSLLPNLTRLSREGVSFASHYTASNDCTPARSTLLTGLYTHQTGCMITGGSTLEPGFPTWGTMLREQGYKTYWYGKWHLTHGDNKWNVIEDANALERYGFQGGTYPSPDGAPGQGWRVDPFIVSQFREWLDQASGEEPWCTTVSLVNPHDIAWWYRWSDRVAAERAAPAVSHHMPLNFETPELLEERGKPRLQISLQETAAQSFGEVPFEGPEARRAWLSMLDLYAKLQSEVDRHVGTVLQTLQSRPEIAANTVIVFTSDHGEYGGAHGLRGKGASAYEEGIRVPLIVKDPRGVLTKAHRRPRRQLTSSVDIAPLLLTIASGSEDWRQDPHYEHLADRLAIAPILSDPSARGRTHILHATDEVLSEFALEPYAANAPRHVLALRTARAKFVTYSNWAADSTSPLSGEQEVELYDYREHAGRLELTSSAGQSRLQEPMYKLLSELYRRELARPLPAHLRHARHNGLSDYYLMATRDARGAAAARLRRAEERDRAPAILLEPDPAKRIDKWSGARPRPR